MAKLIGEAPVFQAQWSDLRTQFESEVNRPQPRAGHVVLGKVDLCFLQVEEWPPHERKVLNNEARAIYFLHNHATEDIEDVPQSAFFSCLSCRIRGMHGMPMPPDFDGWERITVQACQPIRLEFVRRIMRDETGKWTEQYKADLRRDIVTFGLVLSW